MLLTRGRQIGTCALFGALFGQWHALALRTCYFARGHGVDATARMVIDAVDSTRKLEWSLLHQRSKALLGMSAINQR
ncbi:MAG: hypothetical protein BGP22_34235 [Variovorax sp. 67-131]|nr:MAG: hypothetical protein ABS94_05425 [Variovorax sp. SCN 67-85]ODV26898.1 MAG: hypothetical protein ABT25_04350 [Variovorax sp. SCN 67-20]OJZ08993.1 MAG: hypothetical protein BGP22_34235 [Variovorax sp. 67-131]